MKKLPSQPQDMFRKLNELIDLVNSQQEAIEKLQEHVDHEARHVSEPADDIMKTMPPAAKHSDTPVKPVDYYPPRSATSKPADDTHRTVTLRIPKDTKLWVTTNLTEDEHFIEIGSFDTREEAQKALYEVKGESNDS